MYDYLNVVSPLDLGSVSHTTENLILDYRGLICLVVCVVFLLPVTLYCSFLILSNICLLLEQIGMNQTMKQLIKQYVTISGLITAT